MIMTGCNFNNPANIHHGAPFTLEDTSITTIKEMDTTYTRLIRYNQPVRVKGTIKYQCKIKGSWAFIDDTTGLVFINFAATSPNISIPKHQLRNPIVIEGHVKPDNTVVNDYHILPYAFEFLPIPK